MTKTYEYKTKPYAHQLEALRRSLPLPAYAFLMEMGTGKTKVAVDEIGILFQDDEIDAAVVIAPKGVYSNWTLREIPTHMPDEILSRSAMYLWDGLGTQRGRWLSEKLLDHRGLSILVMNIEAVSSSAKAQNYLKKFLSKRRAAVYVDESTTIKNPTAMRTKILTKLCEVAVRRRIMSGSPITRSPLDYFSQFNFLKKGLIGTSSYFAFRARYGVVQQKVFGGRSVQVVVGYQNLEELTSRVAPYSYRVRKDECLDLPDKVYERREVELSPEQARLYAEMREDAFAEFSDGGFASATIAITKILRLHQIVCGHVVDADGRLRTLTENRVGALLDVVAETDEKVIVWSAYRHDTDRIVRSLADAYGPRSVVRYDGTVSQEQGEQAVDRFQNDPECRFFVGTQAKGGYGITLTAAGVVVYYSNTFDLEKRLQSEDRAHRSGQTKKVLYVDLVSPDTVDEKILQALREKKSVADLVVGDGVRLWLS